MAELRTKTFSVQLKIDDADPEGTVYARFATLNVIDHDGDVIRPKAIGKQKVGAGLHNHMASNPTPAGYGDTYEEDDAAYARLTYITDTWAGRETYTYLKAMADAKRPVEWSMRYYVTDGRTLPEKDPLYQPAVEPFGDPPFEIKKMLIIDVDPVSKGAGVDTATVAAKECGPACRARQSGADAPTVALDGPIFDYERLGAAIAASVVEALGKSNAPSEPSEAEPSEPVEEPNAEPSTKGQALGDLLRELRDERELSNDDLADAAGISVSTMGQILGGTSGCPPVSRLQGLARRLNVNLSRLITAAEADGCDRYEEEAATGEPSELKEMSDEDIQRAVERILTDTTNEPPDIDPGLAAYERYMSIIGGR